MVNTNLRLQRPPTRTKHRPNDPKPEHRSRVRAQKQPRSIRARIGLFLEVFQQSLVEAALRRKTSGEAKGPAAATTTPPPSGHKCVRAVSSAAAGADSYLSRCSRCPGAILHRVPSHKSHRSLRRVSRQTNALRSQLRRFPLSTGNTGAPAPRSACGEQSGRLRRCSSRERRTLRLSLPPAADLRSQVAESTTLSKPFQNKAEMTSHHSITAADDSRGSRPLSPSSVCSPLSYDT